MGIISTLCWLVLVLTHLGHGVFLMTMVDDATIGALWDTAPEEYLGGRTAHGFIKFLSLQGGWHEVMLSLAAFSLGDSKLCYSLLLLCQLPAAAGVLDAAAKLEGAVTSKHWEGFAIAQKVVLAQVLLALVGFVSSSRKNDQALRRSRSTMAAFVIKSLNFIECGLNAFVLLDPVKFFALAAPGFTPLTTLSPVGLGVFSALVASGASANVALTLLLIVLKPTRLSCALGVLMHIGLTAVHFITRAHLTTFKMEQGQHALLQMTESGFIFHSGCLVCFLLAFALGVTPKQQTTQAHLKKD